MEPAFWLALNGLSNAIVAIVTNKIKERQFDKEKEAEERGDYAELIEQLMQRTKELETMHNNLVLQHQIQIGEMRKELKMQEDKTHLAEMRAQRAEQSLHAARRKIYALTRKGH